MEKPSWIIHYVHGGKDYICDAHTHGLDQYNHLEMQVVVDCGPNEVARLLNTVGDMVRSGKRFVNGEEIEGLYDDCSVFVRQIPDCSGTPVLRLIIPDRHNQLPENAEYPYSVQMLTTSLLFK